MKRTLIVTALALALVMVFSGVVLAETKIEFDWDGAGWVGGSVETKDSLAAWESFSTHGHKGAFTGLDKNNNPYKYGVDTNIYTMKTEIFGGGTGSGSWGEAFFTVDRTNARTNHIAGQQSHIGVYVAEGDATLGNKSTTSWSKQIDSNYETPWAYRNNHVTVSSASYFEIDRWMKGGAGNEAGVEAWGSGSANLTAMSCEATPGQVRLGWGAGSTTKAKFNATGTGSFRLWADGNNNASTALRPELYGTSIGALYSWTNGGIDLNNYSATAE